MAARKSPKTTKRSATKAAGFTAEERAAMRERAREAKAAAGGANDEQAVLEKIAAMHGDDRALAERLHALVRRHAPGLAPRLWYGMPAYAKDGKVLCFFQDARKFKSRYATLGFSDQAALDDGHMWPTSFALTKLSAEEERRIVDLLTRAVR